MKKILILFFFFLLFLLSQVTAQKKELFLDQEEILVKVNFDNKGITTKNIDQKLSNVAYKLFDGKVKINLSYEDEAIKRKLEQLTFRQNEKLERDYQAVLKRFGLEEDLQKAERVGVPLEEIIILISKEEKDKLIAKGYLVSPI